MIIFSRRQATAEPNTGKDSRRQFHRALRRHPAWPAVMEQAAARAQAQKGIQHNRAAVTQTRTVSHWEWLRRILSRNRTNVIGMGRAFDRTGLRRFALKSVPFAESFSPGVAAAAWRRSKLRRKVRRNRVLLVTLIAVGGVALMLGIASAYGNWFLPIYTQNPPKGRFGAATTYDEAREQFLIFGGFVGSTSASDFNVNAVTGPPILNDGRTWILRGGTTGGEWLNRNPVQAPSPRGFASMAYDGARRNVVLFGGAPYNTNNVSGETWTWDGQDWTPQTPPEPRPDPRQNAVMFYDALRREVVMFGGRGADGKPLNDTWTWNGSDWKIVPRTAGDPSPRHSAAVAYDECAAQAVMFGGTANAAGSDRAPFETWTWDGFKWILQSPRLSPPSRIGASMDYSRITGNVLLYGGLATNEAGVATAATDEDVWRWVPNGITNSKDAPTWEKMISDASPADNSIVINIGGDGHPRIPPPPPRAYASFAYFGEGNSSHGSSFWLFGGTPAADPGSRGVQLAYGDQYWFGDGGFVTGIPDNPVPGVGDTPLTRRCVDPEPIDDVAAPPEAPKLDVREGMREVDQFPVLTGTDWPENQRDTHLGSSQSPTTPNPNHTPPPDCPNRSQETGSNTHLFTDGQRNRVYQFFICDPDRGRAYYKAPGQTSVNYQARPQVNNLLIEVYDGAPLRPLGRVVIGTSSDVQNIQYVQKNLQHDVEGGRFFLKNSFNEFLVLEQERIEKGIDPVVRRIDLTGAPSFDMNNFFFHPKTGRPKAFFWVAPGGPTAGPPPASSTPGKIGQWDIEGRREDWRVELPGCTANGNTSGGYLGTPRAMRSADHVHLVCFSTTSPGRYAAGKVLITENADGIETPGVPGAFSNGPYWVDEVWGDPQAERMLIRSQVNSTYTLWVFDGKASRWVGRVGLKTPGVVNWGFDDRAGRLYAHMRDNVVGGDARTATQGGVKVIDTRLTPVSQALNFPQFAFPPGGRSVASLPSAPGVPRRVFIRQAAGTMKKYPNWETVTFDNEMFYRVLADETPVSGPAELAELDALTIPVAEKPGKTEVSFDAEGSGYGIRLRSIGGIWSALRIPPPREDQIILRAEGSVLDLTRHLIPACVFPDRELMAGWVPQARLSDIDAQARSSGLEVDSNSKTDLTGPFSRCNPTAEASNFPASVKPVFDVLWPLWQMVQSEGNKLASQGTTAETGKDADAKCGTLEQATPAGKIAVEDCTQTPAGTISRGKDSAGNPTVRFDSTSSSWDRHFKEVECVGDALKDYRAAVGNIYGSAKCVQTQGKVEAAARGSATGSGPLAEEASKQGFSVAEGYSTVEVTREPNGRGVVVTSRAIAKGIQIPGLTIARVETKAVAWSNGRPSDPLENPRATFTREICGVVTPDYSNSKCLSTGEQKTMVDNWNARWGVHSKMYLPTPDPEYYQGSPGGYIAGVIKPIADEVEDQLFAKDSQREVPGLVIDFYRDSETQGNARQVLQLAAVRAVAGLGVQCNPDLLYSSSTNDCVALPDDLLEEEFFEEEEEEFFEEEESELDGEWIPVEALEIPGESLGSKIGKLLDRLPIIRQLPIRQMGEALLASSVWVLLGLPLLFAWRRLSLNNMEVRS